MGHAFSKLSLWDTIILIYRKSLENACPTRPTFSSLQMKIYEVEYYFKIYFYILYLSIYIPYDLLVQFQYFNGIFSTFDAFPQYILNIKEIHFNKIVIIIFSSRNRIRISCYNIRNISIRTTRYYYSWRISTNNPIRG